MPSESHNDIAEVNITVFEIINILFNGLCSTPEKKKKKRKPIIYDQ